MIVKFEASDLDSSNIGSVEYYFTNPERKWKMKQEGELLVTFSNGQKYLYLRNVATNSAGRTLRVTEATFFESVSFDRQVPFKIEEKTDFHFEAKSSSSTNEVSLFVEAILVRNS